MTRLLVMLLFAAALAVAAWLPVAAEAAAGYRLIVNAANPAARLDKRFVAEAFLKKRTRWDDDRAIQPVDLGHKAGVRGVFSRDVLGRDVVSVRRYWAQLVFAGRGVPPPELATETEVVKFVAAHGGAIGYVAADTPLAGVKAVEVD